MPLPTLRLLHALQPTLSLPRTAVEVPIQLIQVVSAAAGIGERRALGVEGLAHLRHPEIAECKGGGRGE